MEADADTRAYDALSQHPRLELLSDLARSLMDRAIETGELSDPHRAADLAKGLELTHEDAATPFGNALDVLSRGPRDEAERGLSCALAAHAIARKPPEGREAEVRLGNELLWLATHTPLDATGLLDHALGGAAAGVWDAVAERIRKVDEQERTPRPTHPDPAATPAAVCARDVLGRGEAIVGAVALSMASSSVAPGLVAKLAGEVRDPMLVRVLAEARPGGTASPTIPVAAPAQPSPPPPAPPKALAPLAPLASLASLAPLTGDLSPAPRGPIATALLAVTGLLLLTHGVRIVGRLALAYRRPAVVTLGDDGAVRVKSRTELLGRTLREREQIVPRAALLRAMRDVRYPSLAMYAGLFALAVGSYLGVTTFVDGARSASPSLLAMGVGIMAVGLGLDFVLTSVAPGARARCRLLLVSRDGAVVCVGGVDPKLADALLGRLGGASA